MDVLVHVPESLLARIDQKVREGSFVSRCQFMARATRWYLAHLEEKNGVLEEKLVNDHSVNDEGSRSANVNKKPGTVLKKSSNGCRGEQFVQNPLHKVAT